MNEAKQKALELMQRFNEPTMQWDELDGFIANKYAAKTCALILWDEILEVLNNDEYVYLIGDSSYIDFWNNVKLEIEKL
jgi:hypothetical protein